jgi:arylsulfatase A-like enzyme
VLQPFEPHSNDPLGPVEAFHNQYRNSVLFQERTVAELLRRLQARPAWDDTVVLFLSDHGEQFREHGSLYHNHSLYDQELRVPGWLLAGARAIDEPQRMALRSYANRRTYMQDAHETVVDLLGQEDGRAGLPLASQVRGRSLLRPFWGEPTALLATSTAVWWADVPRYGAMHGGMALIGVPGAWKCHDTRHDPEEQHVLAEAMCGDLLPLVQERFEGAR